MREVRRHVNRDVRQGFHYRSSPGDSTRTTSRRGASRRGGDVTGELIDWISWRLETLSSKLTAFLQLVA